MAAIRKGKGVAAIVRSAYVLTSPILASLLVVTAPPPSGGTPIPLGINMNDNVYWSQANILSDRATTDGIYYIPDIFGAPITAVPTANISATTQWPNTKPTSTAYFLKRMAFDGGDQIEIFWQGNFGDPHLGAADGFYTNVATEVSRDLVNRRIVYSMPGTARAQLFIFYWSYADGSANPPQNIVIRKVGETGLVRPRALQDLQRFNEIRFLKWQSYAAEINLRNQTAWAGGTSAAPVRTITWAGRNIVGGSDFLNERPLQDGVPIETMVGVANAAGVNGRSSIPYNADNAYVDGVADYIIDNLAAGKHWTLEVANEVWNPGYDVEKQAYNEGLALGYTGPSHGETEIALKRYADRTAEVMQRVTDRMTAKGAPAGRIIRLISIQNAAPWQATTVITQLTSTGKLALIDQMAAAPYVRENDSVAFPLTYTGDIDALFDSADDNMDVVLANFATIKGTAASSGKSMSSYEGGQHFLLSDATYMTSVHKHSRMYDLTMRWQQEIERLVGTSTQITYFNFCAPIVNTDKGAFGLLEDGNQPISKAVTPAFQAVIDYQAGYRRLQKLKGTFTAEANSANGAIVGTVSRRLPGSTLTLSDNDGGRLAIDSTTGNVTVANGTLLSLVETRGFTVQENDSRDPNGPRTTTFSYTVTPASLRDDFNDNSLDATKWTSGIGLVSISPIVATGQTLAEVNQHIEITADASGTSNRGMSLISVPDVDLTTTKVFVRQISSGNTALDQGVAFGVPNGNVFHVNRKNGRVELRDGTASYAFLTGTFSAATYSIASYPWIRISKVGANLVVEAAPAAASNPPAAGDWVTIATNTWPASVPTTAKAGVFYFNAFGGTANAKYVFDGFNTASN